MRVDDGVFEFVAGTNWEGGEILPEVGTDVDDQVEKGWGGGGHWF